MLLDQLIGDTDDSSQRGPARVQNPSRAKGKSPPRSGGGETDSRCVQVKSAVRRSEKPVFEALAQKRDTTLSDLIRDFLLKEAKHSGLL